MEWIRYEFEIRSLRRGDTKGPTVKRFEDEPLGISSTKTGRHMES